MGRALLTVRVRYALLLAFALQAAPPSAAQYREPSEYRPFEDRFLAAGVLQRDFRPLNSNPVAESLAIRYDRLMPLLAFRQGSLDILAGYTQYRLGGMKREAVLLAAVVSQDLPLAGGKEAALLLPVVLATDFARSEANGPRRETFNIASLGIGAGLKFRSAGADHDVWLAVAGMAHFSFEGPGTGSGFSPALTAEAVGLFPRALVILPLAVGYRFRLQSWTMSETKFNYVSVSHGPFVGVML